MREPLRSRNPAAGSTALRLGATGFALIAICYGFARFAFGLFLPQIDADLSLGASLSGMIAGGSFLAFCIAIAFAAHLTEWLGARAVSVIAALVAAVAMVGIAAAPSALWLAGAVMLAGSSTALWSFGVKLASLRLGWDSSDIGFLWMASGVGGIADACAGLAVGRFGIDRVHWASLGAGHAVAAFAAIAVLAGMVRAQRVVQP